MPSAAILFPGVAQRGKLSPAEHADLGLIINAVQIDGLRAVADLLRSQGYETNSAGRIIGRPGLCERCGRRGYVRLYVYPESWLCLECRLDEFMLVGPSAAPRGQDQKENAHAPAS